MDLFDKSPFKEERDAFLRLLKVANVNALSQEERDAYDENLKNYRDWRGSIIYAATKGEERGRAEGKNEGFRQVARQMKKEGMASHDIARLTGLSLEVIGEL